MVRGPGVVYLRGWLPVCRRRYLPGAGVQQGTGNQDRVQGEATEVSW